MYLEILDFFGYDQNDPKMTQNVTRMTQMDPKMTQNSPRMTQKDPRMTQNDPKKTKILKFPNFYGFHANCVKLSDRLRGLEY